LDGRYGSPVVARLISTVMQSGKKSLAERIVIRRSKNPEGTDVVDPLETLHKALDNVKPRLEVKVPPRRWCDLSGADGSAAGAPARARDALDRRLRQARKNVPLQDALAAELKDAAAGQGNAIKKRDDTHKMAQANRAFAHFRF
jgi:small subunit ribosomal protein S7